MFKKLVSSLVVITVFIVALVIASMPLIGCGSSSSEASLNKVTLASSVDKDNKPVDATSLFSSDDPAIYCSVEFSSIPDDSQLKADWVYLRGELDGVTNQTIDSVNMSAEGSGYIATDLSRPDNGFPAGNYEVILYLNGEEETREPFQVQINNWGQASNNQPQRGGGYDDRGNNGNYSSGYDDYGNNGNYSGGYDDGNYSGGYDDYGGYGDYSGGYDDYGNDGNYSSGYDDYGNNGNYSGGYDDYGGYGDYGSGYEEPSYYGDGYYSDGSYSESDAYYDDSAGYGGGAYDNPDSSYYEGYDNSYDSYDYGSSYDYSYE